MEPIPFPENKMRTRAFEILKRKAFSFGDFVLASGQRSDYYLDMKPAMYDPEGVNVLADLVLQAIKSMPVDYIGGLEMGAVPLIGPVTMLSYQRGRSIPGFFVRKNVKDHGTMKRIETGDDLTGKNVVILDDVTTTGKSAMIAIDFVREAGAKVLLVLSIVDREEGATEFYAKEGIPFRALFHASEFRHQRAAASNP